MLYTIDWKKSIQPENLESSGANQKHICEREEEKQNLTHFTVWPQATLGDENQVSMS